MGLIMEGHGTKMVVTIAVSGWMMHESMKENIFLQYCEQRFEVLGLRIDCLNFSQLSRLKRQRKQCAPRGYL